MSKETQLPMQGLGLCGEKLCLYHAAKVEKSVFPPAYVWGNTYLDALSTYVTAVNLPEVLSQVTAYWEKNEAELNGSLHEAWQQWSAKAKNGEKYAAGGWAASSMQLSQYIETVKVLHSAGATFDEVLRVGTASGVHTQEEVFALAKAGISKPKLYIVDICKPPLQESHIKAKTSVSGTMVGSFLDLSGEMNNSWPVVTAHFVESFLPTAEQYQQEDMFPEQAFVIKKAFFQKSYDLLTPGGVFIQAIGTGSHPCRFHSREDILHSLLTVGFLAKNVVIVPTTDPLDYANGNHLQGNYFVVAQKAGGHT